MALARRGDDVRLTVAVLAVGRTTSPTSSSRALERAPGRAARARRCRCSTRRPAGRYRVASTAPPEHYEEAVARAVERIRAGAFEKIVLAREVAVHAPAPHDAAAVFGVLRAGFDVLLRATAPGRDDGDAFVGASPELLVRREGLRASTVALAGSTRRRADPAVDAHLGEQLLRSDKDREEHAIVARRIARALRPHSVWVTAPEEPVDHPRREHPAPRDADPRAADAAARRGGPRRAPASDARRSAASRTRPRRRSSPRSRGSTAAGTRAAVGWTDANEDGEFCVALRCALLRGREARLYAGVGVVRDSDPAAELAETEVKLGALLPVLAG